MRTAVDKTNKILEMKEELIFSSTHFMWGEQKKNKKKPAFEYFNSKM